MSMERIPHERLAQFKAKTAELRRRQERKRQEGDGGLLHFVRYFWDVLEPEAEFVDGWALEAMCLHLEAVTSGEIKRLLINVPPGFMKSLLVNVFWPAWEWSAKNRPSLRYVTFSYGAHLTERDNEKFRDLLRSRKFKDLWDHKIKLNGEGKIKVSNEATGWKFASSVEGIGTGERGDRAIIDDPHNVKKAESEKVREGTVTWFRESISNRLNSLSESAIIVIMQRVHEGDVSGEIISKQLGYVHLMIPMEYDSKRHCQTSLGWSDPRGHDDKTGALLSPQDRGKRDGMLAWPERFADQDLTPFKVLSFMWSSQYQQTPVPRGGGIIKDYQWQRYGPAEAVMFGVKPVTRPSGAIAPARYPESEYIVAGLDGAFTEDDENDPSALVIMSLVSDKKSAPKILLVEAWQKWLPMHGDEVKPRQGENELQYIERCKPSWGLVEWVAYECKRRNVHRLLIENKASGITVSQEIKGLYRDKKFGVDLVDPKRQDKQARVWSVQHLFADEMVMAPGFERDGAFEFFPWAQDHIDEVSAFPKGVHDDRVDAMVMILKHYRDIGYAIRKEEHRAQVQDQMRYRKPLPPLYPGSQ